MAERLPGTFQIVKRLFHWELSELAPIVFAEGRPRAATAADQEVIAAYRVAMQEEMNSQRPTDQRVAVAREIADGGLHVWDSPAGAIACVGTVDLAHARVDGIYTPPEFRRRGHATSLTWHLCSLVHRPVVYLSSDADDPAPTRVYEKLGFKVACVMENLRGCSASRSS